MPLHYPAELYIRKTEPKTKAQYDQLYQQSIEQPEYFWAKQAERLYWHQPADKILEGSLSTGNITWFKNAKLNACYNCLDRHLENHSNSIALIWEDNDPAISASYTYQQLHEAVCKFANALKARNIKKGDRVCLYMPMIPEASIAMLACARIGAIHSVVFGGFSPEALANRILDANCECIITADAGLRAEKIIPLKSNVDTALEQCPNVHTVFIVNYAKQNINLKQSRDLDYYSFVSTQPEYCECEIMDANDPLFILYTSGSTGKPKGVLHSTAGYLLYATTTFQVTFDYLPGQVYWCTADIGWITGHSYIVYGPLANRATSLIFSGVPNYPDFSRFWQIIDKHQVEIFYTAPTAIRAIMAAGDEFVNKTNRSSLKILGTVGEPINPEAWEWYFKNIGGKRCPIIDTWWQTETGGFMITPIAGITNLKPGSASLPFFGVQPILLDSNNNENQEGRLFIKFPWPGLMNSVYGDHQRFIKTYLSEYKNYYFSGDGAKKDQDNFYWITGRVDDVMNISGHRIGTAEVESAILSIPKIAEAAVIGFPHKIKGEGIYAFVVLKAECAQKYLDKNNENILLQELNARIKNQIGPFAKPEYIQITPDLPKTRSGKVMRRILRNLIHGEANALGDISTLADPDVVNKIKRNLMII